MLKNWSKLEKPESEELDARLEAAKEKLNVLQMQIKDRKLPVLVLFEGWGTAGKGSTLGKIITNIDPRFFKVATMDIPTEEERRKPFLYRYFNTALLFLLADMEKELHHKITIIRKLTFKTLHAVYPFLIFLLL